MKLNLLIGLIYQYLKPFQPYLSPPSLPIAIGTSPSGGRSRLFPLGEIRKGVYASG